jgi:hypothetical protein
VFGTKAAEMRGTKVSPTKTIKGEGIVKHGVEKSLKIPSLI